MNIFTVIFGVAALLFGALWLLSRRNLGQAVKELKLIRAGKTGRRLRLASPDRQMEALVAQVNHLLDEWQMAETAHRRAEKERRDEIANISHDLRTPLTSILGYLQLLQKPEVSREEQLEYLAIAESRAKALQSLLSGFYDLSRLAAGGYPLEIEAVQPAGLLFQLAADFYADFLEAGIEPRLEIPQTLPMVYADRPAIIRVFQNLMQNAVKHGGKTLTISFTQQEGQLTICFTNEAPFLTEADCQQLFDRFFTADRMRTGQNTGLGLAIVRALCEKMGGSVTASLQSGMLTIETTWRRCPASYQGNGG